MTKSQIESIEYLKKILTELDDTSTFVEEERKTLKSSIVFLKVNTKYTFDGYEIGKRGKITKF